jgi:Uncharacterized protein involved in biosynthesis of c-type cytochromes
VPETFIIYNTLIIKKYIGAFKPGTFFRNTEFNKMKTFKTLIIIFLLLFFNNLFANENSERNEITKNLRCLICQGQSVYDSDSDFANSMKILVDKKLNEGLSDKEIYSYFKEKYGDWILYDPGLNKNTYLLWLLPILIFLFGGAIIVKSFIFKK